MGIINCSRWSISENITKSNKSVLLQHLIWEEVVSRREVNMGAFRRGMDVFGMVSLLQEHPVLTKPLLVSDPSKVLTPQKLISLIESQKSQVKEECLAFKRFIEFIEGNTYNVCNAYIYTLHFVNYTLCGTFCPVLVDCVFVTLIRTSEVCFIHIEVHNWQFLCTCNGI